MIIPLNLWRRLKPRPLASNTFLSHHFIRWSAITIKQLTGEMNNIDYLITAKTHKGWEWTDSSWSWRAGKKVKWEQSNFHEGQIPGMQWLIPTKSGPRKDNQWIGNRVMAAQGKKPKQEVYNNNNIKAYWCISLKSCFSIIYLKFHYNHTLPTFYIYSVRLFKTKNLILYL